jgi:hypothetical protein
LRIVLAPLVLIDDHDRDHGTSPTMALHLDEPGVNKHIEGAVSGEPADAERPRTVGLRFTVMLLETPTRYQSARPTCRAWPRCCAAEVSQLSGIGPFRNG